MSEEERIEALAQKLAERINGGQWLDRKWYTEEQRQLWREHARVLFAPFLTAELLKGAGRHGGGDGGVGAAHQDPVA